MPDLYYLEKNVLSQEELEFLTSFTMDNLTPDLRPFYLHSGPVMTGFHDKEDSRFDALRRAVDICHDTFVKNYEMTYDRFELKRLFGNVMMAGAINHAHDDDGDKYPGKPDIEEHYSAVLMLEDEYTGGEFYFQHKGVEVRLEAGDLIMFRGNAENLHGVRTVLSGKRVNVIIFFRNYPSDVTYSRNDWKDLTKEYGE
jgi:hypothetical protein